MFDRLRDTQSSIRPMPPRPDFEAGPIRTATTRDRERCLETLSLAFENDPPSRWIWRERQRYHEAFPRFAQAFGGGAVDLGVAHFYQGYSGVAFWLPPGSAPDSEAVERLMRKTVPEERMAAVFSIFEEMEAFHPHEPHWHLPLVGVHPARQGRGIGSVLLRQMLDQCDREQMPAYLEATSPRNVALYERLGFETLGRILVADCPMIVPMLRRPR